MGAESNLKEEGGPFIRVVSKRGKAGRAARAGVGDARGSAILSCISELERCDDRHLVVTREGMLSTLEASYEKQLKKGGLKDSNKRRSVRGAMREELEELLETKGWRIVDVRGGLGAGCEA